MKSISIKKLSLDSFKVYGSFAMMLNPDTPKLCIECVDFYRDMEFLSIGQNTDVAFSVTRVEKRPNIIDSAEYHKNTGEAIIPLDGDILIHVGIATPNDEVPYDKLEVFHVPKGALVTLRPGVWHYAPFAYKSDYVNVLVVLPERTYANDSYSQAFPKEKRFEIK